VSCSRCRIGFLAVLASCLLAPAALAGQFQVREIKVGDKRITVMIYGGQSYRKLRFSDLNNRRLAKQLVCLEGKLKSAGGAGVRLFGTDHQFKHESLELFRKLVPGDNVWIGGKMERTRTKLNFSIAVVVKLKTDLELFEKRFKVAGKAGDWKFLLELADWIDKSKDYNPKIAFDEHRRYRTCKTRAINKACLSAEAAFKEADAIGYANLAIELLKLGADRDMAYRYFRRAAAIDPELEAAAKRLAAAGFLRWHGKWVTREEKKKLAAAELVAVSNRVSELKAREDRRSDEAVLGARNHARDVIEVETALAALRGAEAAARMTSEIEKASEPRLGRRVLALVASLPVKLQAGPIAAAMRSAQPQIRAAALELAASRQDLAARKTVVQAARKDSSREVIKLACEQLGKAGDVDAMALLVSLVGAEKDFRSRLAVEVLRKTTREDRFTKAEWAIWWKRNKASFPPGPK
jgi:HEAT repeats